MRGLLAAFLLLSGIAAADLAHAQEVFHLAPLKVETKAGPVSFRIEFAASPEQRARGLMFRRDLADDAGMLFDFGQSQDVSMWMKNTYIPLDMLFIRNDGSILRIEESTTPYSLDTITSGGPVRFVFEIAAGRARQLGIGPGDKVSHPAMEAQ